MTQLSYPKPARWYFLVTALTPFAAVVGAALITRMNAITAIVAFIATLGAMAAAGTFVMSWHRPEGRSRWWSTFVLWINRPKPNPLQHWYVPVVAGAAGGAVSEVARTIVVFAIIGVRLSWDALVTAAAIGILEGLLIALVFGAGFGLVGFVRPRFERLPPN